MKYNFRSKIYESLRSAKSKYPDVPDFVFKKFLDADKSDTYKYVEKMCQFFHEGHEMTAIISKITEYQKIEIYLENKDITKKTYFDILDDIEEGNLRKEISISNRRRKSKLSGLIYDKNGIRIYKIDNFKDAQDKGKSTKWCTSLNQENFDLWTKNYNMYIIFDMNWSLDSPLRKICFLVNTIESTFVTAQNVHYFPGNPDYDLLIKYFGPEIMSFLI